MSKIDWKQVEQWNKDYVVKCFAKESEYGTMFVESAEGDYLIDASGNRWLDFYNQLYCVNAGQRIPEVQQAIKDATDRYGFVWDVYTTDYKAEAAKVLIEDILGKDSWAGQVRFTLGGGDSVEVASLIARLLTGKHLIATREFGYHGVSSGAVSFTRIIASRNNAVTEEYGKSREIPGADYNGSYMVPAPFCYRCALGHSYPECKCIYADGTLPCVKQTELVIRSHGVQRTAAIITEPAQGAGTIIPPKEYLAQIQEMKNRLGILWIMDEVLMGFGRLGEWFGHQAFDGEIKPDIMTTAKGLTSSALPAGAVVISKELAKQLGEMRWNHVSTFSGHPIVLAAAAANMKHLIKNNVPAQCKKAGEYFGQELLALHEKHPSIGFIGGKGMFWQVELVKDRETKEPFITDDRYLTFAGDQSKYPIHIIEEKCAEKGVLLGGFLPNTLRIGASCVVSKADMDKAIDALDYGLTYLETQL